MNAKRSTPFFITIGVFMLVVLGTGLFRWLSSSETQEVIKVYKATQPVPAGPKLGLHADTFLAALKEELAEDKRPETRKYIEFLESEEGQAFLNREPTLAEINEVKERYIPPTDTDLYLERIDGWYRQYFPTGTLEESEQEILDMIKHRIQARGFLLSELKDPHRVYDLKWELALFEDERLSPSLHKKFDGEIWAAAGWLDETVKRGCCPS